MTSPPDLARALGSAVRGRVSRHEPLAQHTSLAVGGPADFLVRPRDEADLLTLIRLAQEFVAPIFFLGNGTNLLASDDGVRGLVVKTSDLRRFEIRGTTVVAEAGTPLPFLSQHTVHCGLIGLEFAAGIPGTIGGAVLMNAGVPGVGDIGDVVQRVRVVDPGGKTRDLDRAQLEFGYRTSRLQQEPWAVVAVELRLEEGDAAGAQQRIGELLARRRAMQPLHQANAGSIFRNPPGDFAGRLVEAAGCKGLTVGGARVSCLHANFIVNTGRATAADIRALIRRVRDAVYRASGITLETELRFLGEDLEEGESAA